MNDQIENYIIDFERVNELTSTAYDDKRPQGYHQEGTYAYTLSRKLIKEYLDIFSGSSSRNVNQVKLNHIIKTLKYNKIILDESDIRDEKINKVLFDE